MRKGPISLMLAAVVVAGMGLGSVRAGEMKGKNEPHPRIHHARHELEEAKGQLEKADHDFGGHRAKALELTNQAIQELDQALEYAKAHPEESKEKK